MSRLLLLAFVAVAGLATATAEGCDSVLLRCADTCNQSGLAAVTNVCKATPAGFVKLCVCGNSEKSESGVQTSPDDGYSDELESTVSSALGSSSSTASSTSSTSSEDTEEVDTVSDFVFTGKVHAPAPVDDSSEASMISSDAAGSAVRMPCDHSGGAEAAVSSSSAVSSADAFLRDVMGRRFGPIPMTSGSTTLVRLFPVNFVDPFFGVRQAFLAQRMTVPSVTVIRVSSSSGAVSSDGQPRTDSEADSEESAVAQPRALPGTADAAAARQLPSEEARAVSDLMNQMMARVFMARSAMVAEAQAQQQFEQQAAAHELQQRAAAAHAQERARRVEAVEALFTGLLAGLLFVLSGAFACCCCCGPLLRRKQAEIQYSDVVVVNEASDGDLDQPLMGSDEESSEDDERCPTTRQAPLHDMPAVAPNGAGRYPVCEVIFGGPPVQGLTRYGAEKEEQQQQQQPEQQSRSALPPPPAAIVAKGQAEEVATVDVIRFD